jgi:uncharacterized membrane protein YpjA
MISGLSRRIRGNRSLIWILIIVNFLGFLFGIYYYMPQLDDTPEEMWLLVIDCPLYVLLFSIILFMELLGRPLPPILKFITSVGLFKYGLWTVIVILSHYEFFFTSNPLVYGLLLPMHVGMTLESILLYSLFPPTPRTTLFVVSFFVLNDLSDYLLGTLPRIPDTWVSLLFIESLIVSIFYPLVLCFYTRRG